MTTDCSTHLNQLMEKAVACSIERVHAGGIPFAALVVDDQGRILGRGVNRVRELHDPTAHAEVEAIRDACRSHGVSHLHGTTLIASGEPCAMCYMNALFAGVSSVFFAADRDEAAAHGFDYRGSYALFSDDPRTWKFPSASKLSVPDRLRPFLELQGYRDATQRERLVE